jgi:cation diffusion facilitator CzcD-associated flavoprotein CzcO
VARAGGAARARGVTVAIIGGGFGGIAAAVKLSRAGFRDFTVFEAEAGPGGTWWRNTYPGCQVDVPSGIYEFSFLTRNWTRTHASQPELMEYVDDVLDAFDLRKYCRFGVRVEAVRWDERRHQHQLTLDSGEAFAADVVISAVGFLTDPKLPDWPGLDSFAGPKFHTLYWDHGLDLGDKTVAIVGTGSTAAQIVPAIASSAGRVVIFQREPGWILPKGDRDHSPGELAKYTRPLNRRVRRLQLLLKLERSYHGGAIHHVGSERNAAARRRALAFIDSVFQDRPDLKAKVTPAYEFSGKRRILQDDFYATLLRDNVELVARPVATVLPHAVVDDEGTEYKADVLVMSTGFHASKYLSTLEVTGRTGRSLQTAWSEGPYAFLGMMVPEFPNFYMLYGPNTNGGPILQHHEMQARYIVRDLRTMRRRKVTAIEVRPGPVRLYNAWLQKRLARTAWAHANNYMKGPTGSIVTQWGDGLIRFWALHQIPRWITSARRRNRGRG